MLGSMIKTPVGKIKVARPRTSAEKAARTKRRNYVRGCTQAVRVLRKLTLHEVPAAPPPPSTATGSRKSKTFDDSDGHPSRIIEALGEEGLESVKQWIRVNFRAAGKKNTK